LAKKPQQATRLSVCMIVRNEAEQLSQCLSSIQAVADEIIVVDTGSRDNSRTIARQYGAKVFDFEWRDNFAAARNFSLEQAGGNWILVLDADETIATRDHQKILDLVREPATTPVAYKLLTRNYTNLSNLVGWRANVGDYSENEAGCGWIPSLKVRLWSNHPQIRFSYPVHELVEPSLAQLGIAPQVLPVVIHHYGKLDSDTTRKKGERYFQIGWKKLEDLDENARAPLRELAVQAGMLEKFAEAAELWQRFLKIEPENSEALLNLGTALFATGKTREAMETINKAAQINPGLKEILFNQALYELHLGRAADADKKLRHLLNNNPDYLAAHFLQAATLTCQKGNDSNHRAFQQLQERNRGFTPEVIRIAGEELARTLARAGRIEYAEAIKKATASGQ